MSSVIRKGFACLALVGLLQALGTSAASAQETKNEPEKVRFSTADGVELKGSYFTAPKRQATTVMLLHALGEDSRKKSWVSLAEELQKAGFAVLSFDFRGHGESTEVAPEKFWAIKYNQSLVKGFGKSTIDFKAFDKRYYPTLVNDIAAAKAFLDRTKNDAGFCNTSSLMLVGAETGATLGGLWMTSEWFRFKMNAPQMIGLPALPDTTSEGKNVIGAVWLSISPKLGDRTIVIPTLLQVPARDRAIPMAFWYSNADTAGKTIAKSCEKYLKTKDDKYRLTGAVEVKAEKLTGAALLQKSLGTEEVIVKYLTDVATTKGNEWVELDYRKTIYVWRFPGNPNLMPAKPYNEQTLVWDSYEKFLPR